MFRISSALVCLALAVTAAPATALDIPLVDLKVGVRGGPNMAFLPNPVDVDEDDALNPQGTFYGAGWNLGAALQVRAAGIVGLEFGWWHTVEHAEAIIELEGVSDCSIESGRCAIQEVGAGLHFVSHHFPIALHLTLPTGKARPFVTGGVDLVVNRRDRAFRHIRQDPLPSDLDPIEDAELLAKWETDAEAQYYLNADVRREHPDLIAGILVGAGLNIVTDAVEIPIEFRLNIYPVTGDELDERGDFPPPGTTAYDPSVQVRYNDSWNYQLFILFGLDYVIF